MALGLSPTEIIQKGEYQLLQKSDHWERVFLNDISHVQNGFAFKSEFFDRDSGTPLIRIRDITRTQTEHLYTGDYDQSYVVNRGEILIGMDGDFTASRWKGDKALLNQRVCKLTLESKYFDERFFFLCLQPYLNAINAETSSVTVKHLSSKTIEAIPLPLPPLNEQYRIVSKIEELFSELDKGIENLKTAREQLKVYRQAVLKHAFEGKLTQQWREENKEQLETDDELFARIKQEREARYQHQLDEWKAAVEVWEAGGKLGKKPSKPRALKKATRLTDGEIAELPILPSCWFWDKLGWMTCGVEYGTAAKSSESGKVPVLRMGNIQNAKFDWTDLVYTSDLTEINKYLLQPSDVLFNRTNSPELVGKTAIYRGEQPALFAGYLIRVNQIETVVDGQYLNLLLNSHVAKQHGNKVKTDGVNQSNINGEKLQNYPFPYCSISEQQEVVRLLDENLSIIDQMEHDIELELRKSEALRQSILKKAFSGLLVEQNPSDEPASVLLDRIKVEKSAQGKSKKNGKRKNAA